MNFFIDDVGYLKLTKTHMGIVLHRLVNYISKWIR